MAQFHIYNFNSEVVKNNIFNGQISKQAIILDQEQTIDLQIKNQRKLKYPKILKQLTNNRQKPQIQKYKIQKYQFQINPEPLIIQKKKQQNQINSTMVGQNPNGNRKQRDICDFAQQQDIEQYKLEITKSCEKIRDIADFLQEQQEQQEQQKQQEQQEQQEQQKQIENETLKRSNQIDKFVQQFEDFNIQDKSNQQQKILPQKKKHKQIKQYFVFDEYLFLKHPLSVHSQLKCSIKSQYYKSKSIHYFCLQNIKVATCINSNGIFLFQCNTGPIAKMEIINNVYQLYTFDDEIDMIQQPFASIQFSNKLLQNKRYSSIEIYLSRIGGINISPKQYYQINKNTIKLFKSRNPYINQYGKLQLKIDNVMNIRPSNFNCIIEDVNFNQICSLFHTNVYEVNIKYPFNPLLGAACAISRLDWNHRQKK